MSEGNTLTRIGDRVTDLLSDDRAATPHPPASEKPLNACQFDMEDLFTRQMGAVPLPAQCPR